MSYYNTRSFTVVFLMIRNGQFIRIPSELAVQMVDDHIEIDAHTNYCNIEHYSIKPVEKNVRTCTLIKNFAPCHTTARLIQTTMYSIKCNGHAFRITSELTGPTGGDHM